MSHGKGVGEPWGGVGHLTSNCQTIDLYFLFHFFFLKSVFNALFNIHILPEYHSGTVIGVSYVCAAL